MQTTICHTPAYPEIYYLVQPHVMEAMDQVDIQGCMMPESESVKGMCDGICERVLKAHPELVEAHSGAVQAASPDYYDRGFDYEHGYGNRGGLLNDLIYILFLNELFRRRRRYW